MKTKIRGKVKTKLLGKVIARSQTKEKAKTRTKQGLVWKGPGKRRAPTWEGGGTVAQSIGLGKIKKVAMHQHVERRQQMALINTPVEKY